MLEPEERFFYLTPERKPYQQASFNNTTTAIGTKFGNLTNTHSPFPNIQTRTQQTLPQNTIQRLRWLQSRVGKLKVYMTQTPKISRKTINQIFGWTSKIKQISQQRKLVKELGVKVQMLLKENNKLRSYTKNTNEIIDQNEQFFVKEIGSQLSKRYADSNQKQTVYKEIQQNTDIIEYMSRKKKDIQKLVVYQPIRRSPTKPQQSYTQRSNKTEEVHTARQMALKQQLLSIERIKGLKKYFTLYVNTCIQENDQKFIATQRYVKSLEERIKKFQALEQKIDHLKFQKQVKLQQAQKKSKLVSIAGPNIKGDMQSYVENTQSILQQPQVVKQSTPINYFSSKQKLQKIQNVQLESQFITLRQENYYLRSQVQMLKLKYQKQIQNHIRDTFNHEQLLLDNQRLELQNMYLKDDPKSKKNKKKN